MSQKRKSKQLKREKRKSSKRLRMSKNSISLINEEELIQWKEKLILNSAFKDGLELEDIVNKVCKRIGPADLIIHSPKFNDSKGIEKELCDLIFIFKKKLLVFQIKHRNLDVEKDHGVLKNRAEKTIQKLTYQFSTFLDLYNKDNFPLMKTERGVEIKINKADYPEVVFIGIVAFPGQEKIDPNIEFEIINGYQVFKTWPLHLFHLDHFNKISLEIDTPKDLIDYLSIRKRFFTEANIGLTTELNFLAYFKMNPEQLNDTLNEGAKIMLDDQFWETYIQTHSNQILRRNKSNSDSYIYDLVLEKTHESIGFEIEHGQIKTTYDSGTVEAYFAVINELCDVGRVPRRSIGEAIKICLLRCDDNLKNSKPGFAFRLLLNENSPERAFIILSVDENYMSRDKRVNFLHNLCITAMYKFNLKHVCGIATESVKCHLRSYDFAIMGDQTFTDEDTKIKEMAEDIWRSPPSKIKIFEFN